jgi:hypothetical protein
MSEDDKDRNQTEQRRKDAKKNKLDENKLFTFASLAPLARENPKLLSNKPRNNDAIHDFD